MRSFRITEHTCDKGETAPNTSVCYTLQFGKPEHLPSVKTPNERESHKARNITLLNCISFAMKSITSIQIPDYIVVSEHSSLNMKLMTKESSALRRLFSLHYNSCCKDLCHRMGEGTT